MYWKVLILVENEFLNGLNELIGEKKGSRAILHILWSICSLDVEKSALKSRDFLVATTAVFWFYPDQYRETCRHCRTLC